MDRDRVGDTGAESRMHSIRYSICYYIGYIQGMQGLSYMRGIL